MSLADLQAPAQENWQKLKHGPDPIIWSGLATCGLAAGQAEVLDAVAAALEHNAIRAQVVPVGCIGVCYLEPLMDIEKPGGPRICYAQMTPDKARAVIQSYLVNDDPRPDLALGTLGDGEIAGIPRFFDLPMLKSQVRIVLRNVGLINPEDIDHYIASGGYQGFQQALSMAPEAVIDEVTESGLRGRGGAGFPTGQKWRFARQASGSPKYLICNADEGDPGAFMDRSVLEGDPHSVLEGMLIAGYAIGASEGYIYVRSEYPLAIKRMSIALEQMRNCGLLGENILGSGFDFDIKIKEGAGAFVCGEETALIASIEGKRGMPNPRPPFPATSGLWGKPTNINNVETFANLPVILSRGADWFASYGTEKSKGTKTFSLTGKVKRSGLIEVPMGMSLGDVIFSIGGGIVDDGELKAVQSGGPSGGCLPARLANLPIEYESLAEAGSIMGSGGLVVLDDKTCVVDMARYFLSFTQRESCGKCVPCRLGTKQMEAILEDICAGRGTPEHVTLLTDLARAVKAGSLCGLGQTAPNPVLSTLRYFQDEYDAHIREKRCPAAACWGLFRSPCQHACPVGVDVPGYVGMIAEGRFAEAVDLVRERNPFPAICGRVCTHPCESRCQRAQIDDPIAICSLKRAAADFAAASGHLWQPPLAPSNGRKVAIIGGGPAGLTAAYHLRKRGYAPTVFEAANRLGGMLRWGIPGYRLPDDVLDKEIADIVGLGIDVRTGHAWGRDFTLPGLREQGYEAILLAIGAHHGVDLGMPGEALEGVVDGVRFLRHVNSDEGMRLDGRRVVVIGGGDVAIDAARSALRLGADKVSLVYRRTRAEMPAHASEIAAAEEEGVELQFLLAPQRVVGSDRATGLECLRMSLGEFDDSGRRRPEPVPGSETVIEADLIITAIGQTSDVPLDDRGGLAVSRRGAIEACANSLVTGADGVFAAGDAVTGPDTVIRAIAQGERAAIAIDRYLRGKTLAEEAILVGHAPPQSSGEATDEEAEEEIKECPRAIMPCLDVERRTALFAEVAQGFDREQAIAEANRCLHCERSSHAEPEGGEG
ncbi:hypothetical protein AMK68_02235 [candidate division KD3-62 bacterium DG_56]|uniref:NADH-ubiquinone oxidoreductase 51kDa subunit iron-sulphur binding domain-containing protein n=1 Tax=candidate division KD3-62 bacterium DG_56 TaxID=1704032 RepID=A0A0S7XNS2_9BACT|nr:MAG: hypothetical protein AMK68_02235 [candidate division KD3-62 bacterium DG_56]